MLDVIKSKFGNLKSLMKKNRDAICIVFLVLGNLTIADFVTEGLKKIFSFLFAEQKPTVYFTVENFWLYFTTIVSIFIFVWFSFMIYKLKESFTRVRTLELYESRKPHKGLIILLSTPTMGINVTFNTGIQLWSINNKGTSVDFNGQSLDDDVEALALSPIGCNWEMLMRGINANLPKLEKVILICSAVGKKPNGDPLPGSVSNYEDAKQIIDHYTMPNDEVSIVTKFPDDMNGVDFEDLDALTHVLQDAIDYLHHKCQIPHREILIDVTGGQKVTSIAGALITLKNEVKIQYVPTGNTNTIKLYNTVMEDAPDMG